MPITYGLTDQGLIVKTRNVLRDDFNKAIRRAFGNAMNLSDGSLLGIVVTIFSDRLGELWELLETIASSQDPDKATAALLDAICLITGTTRPLSTLSTTILTLTGVVGTAVPSLSQFQAVTTRGIFVSQDNATLVTVPARLDSTTYILGQRAVSNLGVYQVIDPGITGVGTGPSGIFPDVTPDGSVLWTYVGAGSAACDVEALSSEAGPVVGGLKDITGIVNALSGLQGVINLEPAVLGRLVAQDSELRILREAELGEPGSSPFDALRGRLLDIIGVTSITLFANNGDFVDLDGVPPHSVEALVRGGSDQDIFDKLLASVAAGIGTSGTVVGTAIDSAGKAQVERFSRADEILIYARVVLTFDAASYPDDGDAQIQAAIETYAATLDIGKNVAAAGVGAQAFKILPGAVNDVLFSMVYTDVIGAPATWVASTAYSATPGARSVVTNNGRAYICVTSGTSAGSGGPTTTSVDITDNTAHWYFLGNTITITSRQLAVLADVTVTSTSSIP